MKTQIALAGLIIALLSTTSLTAHAQAHGTKAPIKATKTKVSKTVTMYECSKCHMKYTAALAKKDHYVDPMDGGKLIPVKTTKK